MNALRTISLAIAAALTLASPSLAQHAADAYYDPAEMERARKEARREMGGQVIHFLQADRLEYQSGNGSGRLVWEGQGWIGTDHNRFWFKTEGERLSEDGGTFEDAEVQALYSRPISAFFDVQGGVRQDLAPGARRTFGVVGLQGLAPYQFEIDTALFISQDGDVSARLELEYDLLFTQRLILQPRAELNFAVQDVPALGVGAGLSTSELGARLRYEIKREFAPYIGVSWDRAIGRTADFLRASGSSSGGVSFVAGLRLWL